MMRTALDRLFRKTQRWGAPRCGDTLVVLFGFVVLFLGGCATSLNTPTLSSGLPQPPPPEALQPPTQVAVATPPTGQPTREGTPPPSTVLTLTMWTTEVFSPLQNDRGSQVLKEQIADFTAQHPQIAVNFVLKKAYGKGGISDFLQTTGAAVPQMLPDLTIIDMTELPTVARAGLVRPLGSLVSAKLPTDLFPFARKGCTVDGQLVAVPFEVDLIHLIYNTKLVQTAPMTWAEVLSGTASYIFPAGGDDVEHINDEFWLQYLATGTEFSDLEGQPVLNQARLEEVFGFYKQGLDKGIIPKSVLDYRSEADSWPAYLSGKAALTSVISLRYLSNRSLLQDTGFARVPTRDGNAFSLAKGWALAVVAKDQARQEASASLVEWLLQPDLNGAWTRATNRLPASRQALATWDQTDPYTSFITGLLEVAQPYPATANYDLIARALQRSVRDVLAGNASPQKAADDAIAATQK